MSGSINTAVDKLLGFDVEDEKPVDETNSESTEQTADDGKLPAEDTKQQANNTDDASKPEQKQAAPIRQAEVTQGRLPANDAGDLIDPATGAVIAKAGNERRYFEQWRNSHRELNSLRQELGTATAHLNALREAAQTPTRLGLEPAEVDVAMKFMSHWKQNPVEAAKKMLTELRAAGHTIEDLEGGIDTAAISRMLDQRLQPFTEAREREQRELAIKAEVDREVVEVSSRYPWLDNQSEELIAIMNSDPTLTLREAAIRLYEFAVTNSLDLNTSLRLQYLQRQNGNQQQSQPIRPNRATIPAPVTTSNVAPRKAAFDVVNSRDIVREAMREAGLNVDG